MGMYVWALLSVFFRRYFIAFRFRESLLAAKFMWKKNSIPALSFYRLLPLYNSAADFSLNASAQPH
jgi:hypothetical protein